MLKAHKAMWCSSAPRPEGYGVYFKTPTQIHSMALRLGSFRGRQRRSNSPDNGPRSAPERRTEAVSNGVWHPLAVMPLQAATLVARKRRAGGQAGLLKLFVDQVANVSGRDANKSRELNDGPIYRGAANRALNPPRRILDSLPSC